MVGGGWVSANFVIGGSNWEFGPIGDRKLESMNISSGMSDYSVLESMLMN